MSVVYAVGTFVGWAMIGRVVTLAAIRRIGSRRTPALDSGADAIQGVGTRLADPKRVRSEHDMRSSSDHADWWRPRDPSKSWEWSMYGDNSNPDRDPLDETLCPPCLAKARAELDYGVPL